MSHLVEALAYAGETPWHGLGVRLAQRLGAQDMLKCAGLDWIVAPQPVFVQERQDDGTLVSVVVPGVKAIVRQPHGNVLKVLSDEYGIVQNAVLAELADAMAGEMQSWEVAGSLDEGRKVFFCGVLDDTEVAGDRVRNYVTLASSHDGTLAITALRSPIRTVCNNTLQANLGVGGCRITIRHTKNAEGKVKVAAQLCADARSYFGAFTAEAQTLVGQQMSVIEAVELGEKLFPAYRSETTGQMVVPELQGMVIDLFKHQHAVPHDRRIAGTRWGFYQALTAALDHNRRGSDRSRLARYISGTDDSLRSRAWRFLTGK